MTDTLDTQTVAAVLERQKMQRHFGRFDILFFLICTIVGVDTIATVQLIAPRLGSSWFGSDFIPEGWTYAQRFTYLWTELIPVLIFIVIGAVLVDGPADPS